MIALITQSRIMDTPLIKLIPATTWFLNILVKLIPAHGIYDDPSILERGWDAHTLLAWCFPCSSCLLARRTILARHRGGHDAVLLSQQSADALDDGGSEQENICFLFGNITITQHHSLMQNVQHSFEPTLLIAAPVI